MWKLILFSFLFSVPSFAVVSIAPGTYEIPAVIVNQHGKVTAIFNAHTHSKVMLWLKGRKTSELTTYLSRSPASLPKLLKVSFRVNKKMYGTYMEAELLNWKLLKHDEKVPAYVGHNFRPVKKK